MWDGGASVITIKSHFVREFKELDTFGNSKLTITIKIKHVETAP